jgi:hypothetical protein
LRGQLSYVVGKKSGFVTGERRRHTRNESSAGLGERQCQHSPKPARR